MSSSSSTSRPRPIHKLHRELHHEPNETEPSLSYERDSFLANSKEDDVEDEFHRRLQQQSNHRNSGSHHHHHNHHQQQQHHHQHQPYSYYHHSPGNSFWRSSSSSSTAALDGSSQQGPHFNSATMTNGQRSPDRPPTSANGGGVSGSGSGSGGAGGIVAALHSHEVNSRISTPEGTSGTHHHGHRDYRRSYSNHSSGGSSNGGNGGGGGGTGTSGRRDSKKKDFSQQRAADRRLKLGVQSGELEFGHIEVVEDSGGGGSGGVDDREYSMSTTTTTTTTSTGGGSLSGPFNSASSSSGPFGQSSCSFSSGLPEVGRLASVDRASSAESTGSLLYGKTPASNMLLGTSSLIFPSGVENHQQQHHVCGGTSSSAEETEAQQYKRRKVNLLLDQCENVLFPFRRKLILKDLNLTAADVPADDLCGTPLGQTLYKLSLAGNRLGQIPAKLVSSLPALKHLDLSQCELHQLPMQWDLPLLKILTLSHNRLTDFPEESMLDGLPELQELNLYGNKISEIVVPHNPASLSKLENLNLGYNELAYLPDEMDQWKALRSLKVMNNLLAKIPMRVCDMDLKYIDVSSNPVIQPPTETCERGIGSMKRYYQSLRLEEQSKQRAVEELKHRSHLHSSKPPKRKGPKKQNAVMGAIHKISKAAVTGVSRKALENCSSSSSSSKAAVAGSGVTASAPFSPTLSISSRNSAPATYYDSPVSALKCTPRSVSFDPLSAVQQQRQQRQQGQEQVQQPQPSRTIILPTPPPVRADYSEGATEMSAAAAAAGEAATEAPSPPPPELPETVVNDTLKVIFVGMAMVGKTSMIKRLIEGRDAHIPTHDERTVGVDIYEWDPVKDRRFEHIDSRIRVPDQSLAAPSQSSSRDGNCDVHVKFSVWDFAGQHVYHATHELFFSPRALYVLVWDMGATNRATLKRKSSFSHEETGAFKLTYDSSDDDDDDNDDSVSDRKKKNDCCDGDDDDDPFTPEREARRADRALERDIDEKVQFWVDCIQSSAPGAAILPVASFEDSFLEDPEVSGGTVEAKRRCHLLKQRLILHEERRIAGIRKRLEEYREQNRADDQAAVRLRQLLCTFQRPKLLFGVPGGDGEGGDEGPVVRVSGTRYTGFDKLTEKIVGVATGRDTAGYRYPVYRGHVGARIPRMRLQVRDTVRSMRDRFKVVEWGYFLQQLRERAEKEGDDAALMASSVEDISDALHFLTNIGELSYFGAVMPNRRRTGEERQDQEEDEEVREAHEKPTAAKYRAPTTLSPLPSPDGGDAVEYPNPAEDDDDDDRAGQLSMDDSSITAPLTGSNGASTTRVEDFMSTGLSQFVFLNPRWLVAAVACILRHDLDREIKERKRECATAAAVAGSPLDAGSAMRTLAALPSTDNAFSPTEAGGKVTASFYEAHLNCPVITADDACMLWQAKRITKKAAERAAEYSNNLSVTPFEFLQLLLIRFGVFVPIDLSIDKALLAGKEYARHQHQLGSGGTGSGTRTCGTSSPSSQEDKSTALRAKFFFLPSLLGPGEPAEAWTFKNTDSWKTCLCHTVLFPDGVPPGLMERITACVLSSIYAVSNRHDDRDDACEGDATTIPQEQQQQQQQSDAAATYEGRLSVKEVLCWRTAFFIKLGMLTPDPSAGVFRESIVEIFVHLADTDSNLCVGSDDMGVGMRRLILSARGQVGDYGRKIWKGGYLLVCKCIRRVMTAYGGLEYEKHAFCPECLAKKAVSGAAGWEFTKLRTAIRNKEGKLLCRHGHRVDVPLVTGPIIAEPGLPGSGAANLTRTANDDDDTAAVENNGNSRGVPVKDLLAAVVVVGLWDGKSRKVLRVGSGFVVDRKRGLIVTAAHTLMNIWGDKKFPFGENYYGLRQGKVVVGVIPREQTDNMAVFRYFATIVAKDADLDRRGVCHLDACVLRITTRMEQDVSDGDGAGCGEQPERLLLNNPDALKREKLLALKVTEKCELDEQVRILGYNQGGEGLLGPGQTLNRYVDFARGYVCKKFATAAAAVTDGAENKDANNHSVAQNSAMISSPTAGAAAGSRERFTPRQEYVVICPTIGGHSGGPCVNQQGEVIGILSRADPTESQRCYISPVAEWKSLIKRAKHTL